MFGRPTPTKHTRWPASSRAAATIIISDLVNASCSVIGTTSCRPGPRGGPSGGRSIREDRQARAPTPFGPARGTFDDRTVVSGLGWRARWSLGPEDGPMALGSWGGDLGK